MRLDELEKPKSNTRKHSSNSPPQEKGEPEETAKVKSESPIPLAHIMSGGKNNIFNPLSSFTDVKNFREEKAVEPH